MPETQPTREDLQRVVDVMRKERSARKDAERRAKHLEYVVTTMPERLAAAVGELRADLRAEVEHLRLEVQDLGAAVDQLRRR